MKLKEKNYLLCINKTKENSKLFHRKLKLQIIL